MIESGPLLDLARGVALDVAAELAARRVGAGIDTKTQATDMVTEVDLWSERYIHQHLSAARPEDGFIGEEGTRQPGSTGIVWIVDPIDGTTDYIYGHPGFSVSIGAQLHGEPYLGVVADPMLDQCYWASAGNGAFCNGEPIHVSNKLDLDRSLIATGFGYDPRRRRRQAEVLVEVLPAIADIRRMGGAAVDLCSVARGRVDGYFERGLNPWDLCAGEVIVREAGGLVTDLWGGRELGRMLVAAGPGLHSQLLDLLRDARAAED